MIDPRSTVAGRLLLTLCAIAAFSTGLALHLQDRSVANDLQGAARVRLDRSANAAEKLARSHLTTLAERYRAISRTPEFRANLEVDHAPTLTYFAQRLAAQEQAALILFLDRDGRAIATAGDAAMATRATAWASRRGTDRCDLRWASHYDEVAFSRLAALGMPGHVDCPHLGPHGEEAALVPGDDDVAYASARVPMWSGPRLLGHLVALEPLSDELLAEWSDLCGASVEIESGQEPPTEVLYRTSTRLGTLALRVATSLDTERTTLANLRRSTLAAGAVAILFAFAASTVLARGLVRPLRAIQTAVERIGRGDLQSRVGLSRKDEFGEVGDAIDWMLDRLEDTRSRLASAQRLARLGSWELEIPSGAQRSSEECRSIYELGSDAELAGPEEILSRVHPEDRERFALALDECARDGKAFRLDHRMIASDGSERILHSQGHLIATGRRRIEGTVQDVTERKLVEDQVRHLAYHDSLTGLGNRLLFIERLEQSLRERKREGNRLAVVFLDVDDFKMINDTHGHSAGDALLEDVADRLVRCVRGHSDDASLGTTTLCRLGGDEFTLLLSGIEDADAIQTIADRVMTTLAEPFEVKGGEIVVRASMGITLAPDDGDDAELLLRNSDTAMYHAKHAGRGCYRFYTASMQEAVSKRLLLENKLRRAVERDQLELHYQPKVEVTTGRVTGVEALVRWRDPELGLVLPDEFIPIAETTGFIVDIGEWVLRRAIDETEKWREEGHQDLRVSVNLSPHQIEHGSIVETVSRVLEETGFDPALLELEITESTLMRDEENAIALLGRLKDLGVGLSLDDFGTGYSSLSYLRRLPIDTLKIDRSFVRRITTDRDDAALTGAIIAMAKALRLRVIVEGVETEEQRDFLRELGCDEIQGFLYSAPVPGPDLDRTLIEIARSAPKPEARARPGRNSARSKKRRATSSKRDPSAT